MIFATKWLSPAEVQATRKGQLEFAVSAITDLYVPELPLYAARNLVPAAMESWAVGPASAAYTLSDPALRDAIVKAWASKNRGTGVLLVKGAEDGRYRVAYACTERNWSRLQSAGALWIQWPAETQESVQ